MVSEQQLLSTAMCLAAVYHGGQVDRAGRPYVLHLMRVACAHRMTMKQRICALLHDILEDTDIELHTLEMTFPGDYIDTIQALTHRPGEAYEDYLARVMKDEDAAVIKLIDVLDNEGRLSEIDDISTRLRLQNKYMRALEVLAS